MRLRYRAHVTGIESRPTRNGFSMRKRAWFSNWSEPRVIGRFVAEPDGTRINIVQRYTGISLALQLYCELLWLGIPATSIVVRDGATVARHQH